MTIQCEQYKLNYDVMQHRDVRHQWSLTTRLIRYVPYTFAAKQEQRKDNI